jgi:predicted GTPase
LVAFICRTYSILCVNLRQKNKILHTHQGSTREPLFKVVQNAFNFMSLNDSYGHFYENQQGQKL